MTHVAAHTINVLEICQGVGMLGEGFSAGCGHLGIGTRVVCGVEREVAAARTMAARIEEGSCGQFPIWSDLLTFDGRPWRGTVQAIIAGLPCQPYSVAGKLQGHDDERAIWPAFIRVVGEVLPELVFLENVPQFLHYFRPIGDELSRLGYWVEEPVLIAAGDVKAPHERLRFFALAHRYPRGFRERTDKAECESTRWSGARIITGSNGTVDDPTRNEWNGPHREAGARRGVREAGSGVADSECTQRRTHDDAGGYRSEGRNGEGQEASGPGECSGILGDITGARSGRREPGESGAVRNGARRAEPGRRCDDVAACICPSECDCQCPEPEGDGVALCSNSCPVHNLRPDVLQECDYGGARHRNGGWRDSDVANTKHSIGRPQHKEHADTHGRNGSGRRGSDVENPELLFAAEHSRIRSRSGEAEGARAPSQSPGSDFGLFPPGPSDRGAWQRILNSEPWRAPAVESGLRVLVDGASLVLDEARADQLRCGGNGCVPLAAAVATVFLLQKMMDNQLT